MKKELSVWERGFEIRTKGGSRVHFVAIINDGSPCPLTVRIGERMYAYPLSGKYVGVLGLSFDAQQNLNNMDLVIHNKPEHTGGVRFGHGGYEHTLIAAARKKGLIK